MIESKLKTKVLKVVLLCLIILITSMFNVSGFLKDSDGKKYIMAYGNDIDGDIAAVKKLISARDLLLNPSLLLEDMTKVIDDFDLIGISVNDLLRNPSNKPYYNQRGSDNFANIVSRILNNNNFEISIKNVKMYK